MSHVDDERVGKVFIVIGDDASLRKCLICEQVFSRRDSFEPSMFPCQPTPHPLPEGMTPDLPTDSCRSILR